jgi:SAM-dependent methyltransferase
MTAFHDSLTWFRLRILRAITSRKLNQAVAAEIPAGANVLDAGAGYCPYKPFLSHTNYESTDVQQRGDITYVCDICSIPVNDGRYDFILFNQCRRALPKAALRELARVLKKGGRILYTGPLFYEEHEQPYDFYRYTHFAQGPDGVSEALPVVR